MVILKKRFWANALRLSSFVGGMLVVSGAAYAQVDYLKNLQTYDTSRGYSYGVTSGLGKVLMPSNAISISEVTLNDATAGRVMGCAGMDYHETMKTALDADSSKIDEYFGTPMADYYKTTLYNSPSVANMFNSMMMYGDQQVKFMQEKCAATEVADTSKEMRSQALQECVDSYVGGNYDNKEQLAAAYKSCLLSADGDTGMAVGSLTHFVKETVQSPKWAGTLHESLSKTSFCSSWDSGGQNAAPDDTKCSLLAYLPNYRWCVGSQIEGETCEGGDAKRVSDPAVPAERLFDIAFFLAQRQLYHGVEFAYDLALTTDEVKAIDEAEHFSHKTMVSSAEQIDDLGDGLEDFMTCNTKGAGRESEDLYTYYIAPYKKRADISSDIANTLEGLGDRTGMSVPDWDSYMTPITSGGDWNISAQGFKVTSGEIKKPGALELLPIAITCASKNELRMSLLDFYLMANAGPDKTPAMLGTSFYMAQHATERLLSYVHMKLQKAYAEMQFTSVIDKNTTPSHVRRVTAIMIDEIDRKIKAIQAMQQKREGFAQLLENIRDKNKGIN